MKAAPVLYKRLIERGRCTIDDIPEICREETQRLLNGETMESIITSAKEAIESNYRHGAITLGTLNIEFHPDDGGRTVVLLDHDTIFRSYLDGKDEPIDIAYGLTRVENVYNAFDGLVDVQIDTVGDTLALAVNGFAKKDALTYLRIDLSIQSSNYEDMRLTIYLL